VAAGAGGARAGPSRGESFLHEPSGSLPLEANRHQTSSPSDVPSFSTPSPQHPPASALLSLSPPTTVRRTSSHSALPDTAPGSQAPRRSRILRKSSVSSASDSDFESTLDARYGNTDDEDENVLSALSINVSPAKKGGMAGSRGPSKRSGRHSVAAGTGPMTLREQEQVRGLPQRDMISTFTPREEVTSLMVGAGARLGEERQLQPPAGEPLSERTSRQHGT
jgi:hypothetical protein